MAIKLAMAAPSDISISSPGSYQPSEIIPRTEYNRQSFNEQSFNEQSSNNEDLNINRTSSGHSSSSRYFNEDSSQIGSSQIGSVILPSSQDNTSQLIDSSDQLNSTGIGDESAKYPAIETDESSIEELDLPIGSHLKNIYDRLQLVDELLVIGPTGSGKSIGIPWYISRTGHRIVIAVPTVTAAQSLYFRQRNINPDVNVGIAAGKMTRYNRDTALIYTTGGFIKSRLLDYIKRLNEGQVKSDEFIESIDVLMLDEIHVGSVDITLTYELLTYIRNKYDIKRSDSNSGYSSIPSILLTSATIGETKYRTAERYSFEVTKYPVRIIWHTRNYAPNERQLLIDTAKVVLTFHLNEDVVGDFLIFVAGSGEVKHLITLLNQHLSNVSAKPRILPAYSGLSSNQLNQIYIRKNIDRTTGEISKDMPRKIVVATNIAETSITIPGIVWMFDTMMEKVSSISPSDGLRLITNPISKSSAEQRCGRVGRIGNGFCYRMCQSNYYLKLAQERKDEIYRTPIYGIILDLLNAGIQYEDLYTIPTKRGILDLVDPHIIVSALSLLKSLELIDDLYRPTDKGQIVSKIPLGLRNSVVLIDWLYHQDPIYPPYPAIVCMALIDNYGPSYFKYPSRRPQQDQADYKRSLIIHREKFYLKFAGFSDVDTLLNMWLDFIAGQRGSESNFNPSFKQTLNWCRNNRIDSRLWIQVQRTVRRLIKIVNGLKSDLSNNTTETIEVNEGNFTVENVTKALRPIMTKTYYDIIMRRIATSQPTYMMVDKSQLSTNNRSTGPRYYLDQNQAVNRFYEQYPDYLIPLVRLDLKRVKLINIGLDISYDIYKQGQSTPHNTNFENNLSLAQSSTVNQTLSSTSNNTQEVSQDDQSRQEIYYD